MNILQFLAAIAPLSSEVRELLAVVIDAVKQRDPDKAAQYARRAALKQAFDASQKAKRNEPVK